MFLRLTVQELSLLQVAVTHCIETCSHKSDQSPCDECRILLQLKHTMDEKLAKKQKGRP